jgi:hypothetical protein
MTARRRARAKMRTIPSQFVVFGVKCHDRLGWKLDDLSNINWGAQDKPTYTGPDIGCEVLTVITGEAPSIRAFHA